MRRATLALTAAAAALALAACSGGSVEEGTAAPDSFTFAAWSVPVEPAGEWLTSMANDELRVDVYLLGIEPAPEDSSWVDSETDEPMFVAGDDVMLLQHIVTNVGDQDVILPNGDGRLGIDFRGNDYVSVIAESHMGVLLEPYGFSDSSTIDFSQQPTEFDLPIAPGESVTAANVFRYPAGEEILVSYALDRVVDGEVDYDDQVIDGTVELPIGQ